MGSQGKRRVGWPWAAVLGAPVVLLVSLYLLWRQGVGPAIARGESPYQMKYILVAAWAYAEQHGRAFPAPDGAAGLQSLRAAGLLPEAQAYTIYPEFPVARSGDRLAERNVSYLYFGGYGLDRPKDTIILCEKPGLRRDGGFVGLVEGRVAWLDRDAWERLTAALAAGHRPGRLGEWTGRASGSP